MGIKRYGLLSFLAAAVLTLILAPEIQAAVTSKNNPRLKAALKEYPAADANKDGVLTMSEAMAYAERCSVRLGRTVDPCPCGLPGNRWHGR